MYAAGEAALGVTLPQNSSMWNATNGYNTTIDGSSSYDLSQHLPQPVTLEAGEIARLVILGFIFSLLILCAIVGNFLVITAIVTDRNLRKAGNNFVISLAVADALVACLVMTFAAVNDLTYRWSFGPIFCDVWQSSDVMCCTASILNICAVSLDRYIHIKDPLRYRNLVTQRRSLVAVAIIWVMSALLSFLPIHLGWHRLGGVAPNDTVTATTDTNGTIPMAFPTWTLPPNTTTGLLAAGAVDGVGRLAEDEWACHLDLSPWYACVSSSVSFYIPCIVMIVIYARLYRLSQKHRQFMKSVSVTKGLHQTPASSNLHISAMVAEEEEDEDSPPSAAAAASLPISNGPMRRPASESDGDERRNDGKQNNSSSSSCLQFHDPVPIVTVSTRSSLLEGLSQQQDGDQRDQRDQGEGRTQGEGVGGSNRHWSVGSSSVGVDGATGKRRIISAGGREFKKSMAVSRSISDLLVPNGTTTASSSQTMEEQSGGRLVGGGGGGGVGGYIQRQQSMNDGLSSQENNSRHWSVGSSYLGAADGSTAGKRRIFGSNLRKAIAASRSLSDIYRGGTNASSATQQQTSVLEVPARPASAISSHPPRQSDYKTAITVGCIIGIFLFCWGPFFIINIIGSVWGGTIPPVIFTWFTWLGYLNSCANPVIYGVTNVEFRRAFLRILMGGCFAWRKRRWRQRRRLEISGGGGSQNAAAAGGPGRRSRGPVPWRGDNNNYREVRTFDSPVNVQR